MGGGGQVQLSEQLTSRRSYSSDNKMVTTTLLFLPVLVASASAYCEVPLDSESDWPEWPAVITDADGDAFVYPEGSYEDGSRQLYLLQGDQVMLTCSETLFDDDVLAEDNFYYAIAE